MAKAKLLLVPLSLALILAAVLWLGAEAPQPGVVTIGLVAPLTGPAAVYGKNVQNGATLAMQELDASSGQRPPRIMLRVEDEGADPKQAVAAVTKLLAVDRVGIIVGPTTSNGLMAAAPIAERARTVLLSPGAVSANVTQAGDFIFRNRASASQEGAALGRYAATDLRLTRVAVVHVQADYGLSFAMVFREVFEALGGKVVAMEGFKGGETDYRTQLARAAATDPQALFLVGVPIELGTALKQMAELGMKLQVLTNSLESPEIFKIAGDAANGVIFSTTFFDAEHGEAQLKEFYERYRAQFKTAPDLFAANGYDAVRIAHWALAQGARTGPQIRDALYGMKDFQGVAGPTSFDANGDIHARIAIKRISEGRFDLIKVLKE